MHRDILITVPESATDALLEELDGLEHVLSIVVHRGASRRPPGDVVSVHVLNRDADAVLVAADRAREHGAISIVTANVDALIDPEHADAIVDDIDEALWEEAETGLRNHGHLTANYLMTMALGGVLAACALLVTSTTQAIAIVASSIVAPGFEPLAKVPLGLVLHRGPLVRRGLQSAAVGYAVLVVAAALTAGVMLATGTETKAGFLANKEVGSLAHPSVVAVVVSAAGAVAGAIMIAAGRLNVLAGPLVALSIIPAAALIGMGAVAGELDLALLGLRRVGIDAALILVAGVLVFALKQRRVHRRAPVAPAEPAPAIGARKPALESV